MQFAGLNYWAVLVAAIGSFIFGAAWYGALAKPWMAAVGKTADDLKASGRMPVLFLITFLALLLMAWVLAGIIGHLGPGQTTVRNGVISAAFIWLGFVLTTMVVNHGYQGARRMLTMLDAGHWLGVLLIQGAIIGAMGV